MKGFSVVLSKVDNGECAPRQDADAAKKFTREQFNWFRQVAYDYANLPPAASSIAIGLTKYFNRKEGGWSWMSQATLASDIGVSESTAKRALSALVKRGHLRCKRRGREETNLYHLALKQGVSDRSDLPHNNDEVTGQNCTSDRSKRDKVIGQICPPIPLNEPSEEPCERVTHTAGSESSRRKKTSTNRRPKLASWPEAFTLDGDNMTYAQEKGLSPREAEEVFIGFRKHCLAKATLNANWPAAWEWWVYQELKRNSDLQVIRKERERLKQRSWRSF